MHIHSLSRLVILSNGHILLTQAHKKNGTAFYFLPGGHIEYNESMRKAAIRELKEEINIDASRVSDIRLLGVYECSWDDKGTPYHEIAFVSSCTVSGLDAKIPVQSNESHLSFHWQPINTLHQINFLPEDFRTLIPKWIGSSVDQENFFASRFPEE